MEEIDNPVTVNSTPVIGDEATVSDDDSLAIGSAYRITDEDDDTIAVSSVGDEHGVIVGNTSDAPPPVADCVPLINAGTATVDVCPDYVALTDTVMKMPSMTDIQRQCLTSIVASYCPQGEFGKRLLMSLAFSVFGFRKEEEVQVFLPLVGVGIDPTPFAVDMQMDDYVDRGRVLLIILHYSIITFECFDARVRVLIRKLASLFHISWEWYVKEETAYVSLLYSELKKENSEQTSTSVNSRSGKRRSLKWLKIGAAAMVGTSLLVLTGGLAAPALGVGIGTLGLTSASTFIGTATGAALVTSLFGATGGTLAGYKMSNRVGDISEFEFSSFVGDSSMEVTICISGLLGDDFGYDKIWDPLRHMKLAAFSECFLLKWESKSLLKIGNGVSDFAKNQIGTTVFNETLRLTLLKGVVAALAWPAALLSAGYIIDNPWSVAISRSDQAGEILADALLERAHGNRPVTLVGFSTGARVVMTALLELKKAGDKGLGIVENAFLLGCPATAAASTWRKMRSVVAGRLVNAHSNADWVLKFLFRAAGSSFTCSGLSRVNLDGVENVNLSEIVNSHTDYMTKLDLILGAVEFSMS